MISKHRIELVYCVATIHEKMIERELDHKAIVQRQESFEHVLLVPKTTPIHHPSLGVVSWSEDIMNVHPDALSQVG